jgi:hypothetical protein
MEESTMTNELWRYLVAGFLVVHGIGHSGGYWFFLKSWLSPALADNPLKWIFVVVWIIALVGFLAAGVGMLQMQSWWRTAAVASAIVSLLVSVLFIQSPALNAAAADVVILFALLLFHWPAPEVIGS